MGNARTIRLGVLTSSRADFGIYMPLLRRLAAMPHQFSLELIVFGTHLSRYHGHTVNEIERAGFNPTFRIASMLMTDDPGSIASAYALTALKFSGFWDTNHVRFDMVLCLGDRYEMAAAVAAGIPFGVRFAHIHGGETTLGAIDNIYRHSISLASELHFVSATPFSERIKELVGPAANCHVTGSLSLDSLKDMNLQSTAEFQAQWGVDMKMPTALVTLHPETVGSDANSDHIVEAESALGTICQQTQLVVTMPNADTLGTLYRDMFHRLQKQHIGRVFLFENLGTRSYFSCMAHARFLLGNTSSGIIEAASFGRYVVNVGDRQKGRLCGPNVIHAPFERMAMCAAAQKAIEGGTFSGPNIYFSGGASEVIIQALINHFQ